MESHEIPFHTEDEWVVPYGKLPAIRATWFPREGSGRLDVEILVSDGNIIYECFAGLGEGSEGIADGISNFCTNSYHVLLSAFWDRDDPEQVETEEWQIGESTYTAYAGNLGTRASKEGEAIIPEELFETIERAIKNQPLTNDVHWVRHFFANVSGEHTFESLLDNENWDAGLSALKTLPWAAPNSYFSVRSFIVLKKNPKMERKNRWKFWNRK